ncbi:hypothetical protein ABEB36_005155 [Hypothenemus hampei]|uniref:Uncharacterized protein n=1 Tax=Hypothenemus hampei TaxID=57062 RepID=A0ABD1F116_HYPHA
MAREKIQEREDQRAATPLIGATETRIQISSSMDFKSRVRDWWRNLRLKAFCQHVGLLVALAGYTVLGGMVFRRLEYPAEISRIKNYNRTLTFQRQYLIQTIINNTDLINLDFLISNELDVYEKALQVS